VTALLVALAVVWDPAAPAQFEPLFRQHWETVKTARAALDYGLFLRSIGEEARALRVLQQSVELEGTAEALEALGEYERALKLARTGDLLRKAARVRHERGDAAGADKLYREAVAAYAKQHGPAHPALAGTLADLGQLYESQRRFREAEALFRRALPMQQKAHGAMHPEVGTTLNNLGLVVGAQGRWKESEALLRRALDVFEATLGREHERFKVCAANLADLLEAMKSP
jgi:tetratricopeptide (TPR) repeat protein